MGKCNHTPGPWLPSGGRTLNIVGRNGETRVSDVKSPATFEGPKNKAEANANAYLIAAAPDLFAALERLHSVAGGFEEDSLEAALDQALEALAKARGEHG